jgi:oligosaccharide 4-alpha-D-glucosyltransferase
MKKILFLFLIPIFTFSQNANRKFEKHNLENGILTLKCNDGSYLIRIISENCAETSFVPNGQNFNPESHAVIQKPRTGNLVLLEKSKTLTYSSDGIAVSIEKSPFQISYFYKSKLIISEKMGYTKKDSTEVLEFNLNQNEALYGGGSRVLGMNRRGNRLQLYNKAQYGYENRAELMNFCMPLVFSSQKYAVHFDNSAIGYLDLDSKKNNTLSYETISGRKCYQVIADENWEGLVANYTKLTGRQPLPPRWAFGNFASRFGYHSQAQTEKTIQKFQDEKIPLDAVILDLYWFGKEIQGTMGNLEVYRDSFPEFEKMIQNFNKKGIQTIAITEPFILSTSLKWKEAVDKKVLAVDKTGNTAKFDFYFGNSGIVDVFKPEAKEWFWNIYKGIINKGVTGLWGDLGEPEAFPSKCITTAGKADEVHNIYGHNWAKLIADGYKKEYPKVRPFILMRSGYSGSQRFGIIPWSGDVGRNWGGFSGQTEIALQMGIQGMGYMHSDLGGFAGDTVDDELYERWLQYGVFNPIFRPHGGESVPSEPVFRSDIAKAIAKKAIELRYQLLPYNYTIGFENNQKGTPLMRPLFFEEPENEILFNKSHEYFWGTNFLIAPILEKGQKQKTIYFPKSNNWFDFYTDKKFEAGSSQNIILNEQNIPTFVRAGSFIPMTKIIQNTTEYDSNNLILHYFHEDGISGNGKIYTDDGNTANAFEDGDYEILNFSSEKNKETNLLEIKISTQKGNNFTVNDKKFDIKIHNILSKPKKIKINDEKIKFNYDKILHLITFECKQSQNQAQTITIKQ